MFKPNLTILINIFLPLLIILLDLKCVFSMPRQRYRIFRSKGPPPFPPILSFSPPRQASAQNFHSDYAAPPFLMNSMSSSSYNLPPLDLDPPNGLQMEYGPPTTSRPPVVHKHIYVHIPPPEPEEPINRYFQTSFKLLTVFGMNNSS